MIYSNLKNFSLFNFEIKIRNHVILVNPSERWVSPIFFPLQKVSQNHYHKTGKSKIISPREIKIFKKKDELMENICHSLDALLP